MRDAMHGWAAWDERWQIGEKHYCGGSTTSFSAELPANLPQLRRILPECLRWPSEEPVNSGYIARVENGDRSQVYAGAS